MTRRGQLREIHSMEFLTSGFVSAVGVEKTDRCAPVSREDQGRGCCSVVSKSLYLTMSLMHISNSMSINMNKHLNTAELLGSALRRPAWYRPLLHSAGSAGRVGVARAFRGHSCRFRCSGRSDGGFACSRSVPESEMFVAPTLCIINTLSLYIQKSISFSYNIEYQYEYEYLYITIYNNSVTILSYTTCNQ